MITVWGEALVDRIVAADGTVDSILGGGPFTTACALGRLGATAGFVGAVSDDVDGDRIMSRLAADGVDRSRVVRVAAPTTTATALLDLDGSATYRFDLDQTSVGAMSTIPMSGADQIIFTGGLSLVVEPLAAAIETAVADLADEVMVMVDLNVRPAAITDAETYRRRLRRVVSHTDLVKISTDDLVALGGDRSTASDLLNWGAAAVIVTAGADPVTIITPTGTRTIEMAPVEVIDTVGAGDTFDAAVLAWWQAHGYGCATSISLGELVRGLGRELVIGDIGRAGIDRRIGQTGKEPVSVVS